MWFFCGFISLICHPLSCLGWVDISLGKNQEHIPSELLAECLTWITRRGNIGSKVRYIYDLLRHLLSKEWSAHQQKYKGSSAGSLPWAHTAEGDSHSQCYSQWRLEHALPWRCGLGTSGRLTVILALTPWAPATPSPQLWKPKTLWTFPMSPKGRISPSWEPLSKVIKRALDEFYKQGISSAEHVEEQWGRAEPLDSDEGRENGDRGRHRLSRLWWGQGGWKRGQHGDPESHGVLGRGWSHLSIYSKLPQILSSDPSIPTSKYESLPSWDPNEASPLAYSAASESRHQLSSMNALTHALRVRLTLWTPSATEGVKQNTAPRCWKTQRSISSPALFAFSVPAAFDLNAPLLY